MMLELKILEYLNNNDNGNYTDITFIDENYDNLKTTSDLLNEKNFILIDKNSTRDFEAFGISNQRIKLVKAKIKMNGRIHLHALKNKDGEFVTNNKRKSKILSYFFNF
ncbi:MAG: hypothetical protein GQ552_07790 [Flavobacteriaceae bacterium]|nr:hypothetical protein [Flavobacteriaceae bacterium]